MSVRLADRCDPGLPILANRRARAIQRCSARSVQMAPLESCACAAKIGTSRCGSREVSERRPERGGWFDEASAKTLPCESPHQQSPSDADASDPDETRDRDTETERSHQTGEQSPEQVGRTSSAAAGQDDRRRPRRGTRPRKDRPTNAVKSARWYRLSCGARPRGTDSPPIRQQR